MLSHVAAVPIPARMAALPRDGRGYPIPWNVATGKGNTPLFTINDTGRHLAALEFDLCPVCAGGHDKVRWFVGGPGSAFHPDGWYQDLPLHHDCATYALTVCPYLAVPSYAKRVDVIDPSKLPANLKVLMDPTHDPARPPLFVAIGATETVLGRKQPGFTHYVKPSRPYVAIEYWRFGVRLTDADGIALIRDGWPDWPGPAETLGGPRV